MATKKKLILWRGTLKISQHGIPGLSLGDKIRIKIQKNGTNGKETFNWDPTVKEVSLERYSLDCMFSPTKLTPFVCHSQGMIVTRDASKVRNTEQENMWEALRKLTRDESNRRFFLHLTAQTGGTDGSEVYCPIVLMDFWENNKGVALCVSCLSDLGCKKINSRVFKLFNKSLKICQPKPPNSLKCISGQAIQSLLIENKSARSNKDRLYSLEGGHLPTTLISFLNTEEMREISQ